MEAAAMLSTSLDFGPGREVESLLVVGMESEPFERVYGAEVGKLVRQLHESKGVKFVMRSRIREFRASAAAPDAVASAVVVPLDPADTSQRIEDVDIVILGAGISPAIDCLRELPGVHPPNPAAQGGVRVDEHMLVRSEGNASVYAVGDIACFPYRRSAHASTHEVRIEHWDVAMDQGRVAARHILGKAAGSSYDGVPFFWTSQYTWKLRYAGHARAVDRTILQFSSAPTDRTPVITIFYCADKKVRASGGERRARTETHRETR
jgi:NADPH-dependent 2,4-dienoyl-CoA reductase/sulfur reductase-like enzyme